MRRRAALIATVAGAALLAAAPVRAAFQIQLNAGTDLLANPAALAAFDRAAAKWEARFTDDITVILDADVTATGFDNPLTIGGAKPAFNGIDYDTGRFVLGLDAAPNEAIVNALPTAATFTATTPAGRTVAPAANLLMIGTQANFKALGFTGFDDAPDAEIKFNSAFAFDYDNSDGVSPGTIDFESVAIHEIGHALGFTSVIDLYDVLGPEVSPMFLDLFRFGDGQDPSNAAEFSTFARKLDAGAANFDDTQRKYALSSITDGNQASHWKDDAQSGAYVGIMDPTLSYGAGPFAITAADLRALGLIGYDVNPAFLPEPTTLAALGGLAVAGLRRRRTIG